MNLPFTMLFWPREVRLLAKSCQEKGMLSQPTIVNINHHVIKIIVTYSIIFLAIGFSLEYANEAIYITYLILPIIFVLLVTFDLRRFFSIYVETINLGNTVNGKVLFVERRGVSYARVVHYNFLRNGALKEHSLRLARNDKCAPEYAVNQDIMIYLHPSKDGISMPAFKKIVEKYKLKEERNG